MELLKIIGLGFAAVMASVMIKHYKPEFSVPIIVVGGCIFFAYIITAVTGIFDYVRNICDQVGIDIAYIEILFKVVGISYLCEFASAVCKDSGESAVAVKIDIAGKLLILTASLPVFTELVKVVTKILP